MISVEDIIATCNARFTKFEKSHRDHKARIISAVQWWNKNVVTQVHSESFAGSTVNVNGVKCLCIGNDFRGVPFFFSEFIFLPIDGREDPGSGCGNYHHIKF